MTDPSPIIGYDRFAAVDARVGRIIHAERNTKARVPAHVMRIDFGPDIGERTSSAQITDHYLPDDVVGKLIVAVVNFEPKRVAGVKSEVLVLGVPDGTGGIVLLQPERDVPLGGRMF